MSSLLKYIGICFIFVWDINDKSHKSVHVKLFFPSYILYYMVPFKVLKSTVHMKSMFYLQFKIPTLEVSDVPCSIYIFCNVLHSVHTWKFEIKLSRIWTGYIHGIVSAVFAQLIYVCLFLLVHTFLAYLLRYLSLDEYRSLQILCEELHDIFWSVPQPVSEELYQWVVLWE
jgi:hypothetical protein